MGLVFEARNDCMDAQDMYQSFLDFAIVSLGFKLGGCCCSYLRFAGSALNPSTQNSSIPTSCSVSALRLTVAG